MNDRASLPENERADEYSAERNRANTARLPHLEVKACHHSTMYTSPHDLAPLAFHIVDHSDSETSYSTPDPLDPSLNFFGAYGAPRYTPLPSLSPSIHSGFAVDASPIWQPEQSPPNNVATWSPNAYFPPSFAIDSPLPRLLQGHLLGVMARKLSAAFLQLVESHGHGLNDKGFSLLRLLLRDDFIPQDELLAVVDWGRLLSLAVASVSRVIHSGTVASTTTSRPSELDHSPSLLTSNATTTLSDLREVDHFDPNGPADITLDHPISDNQSYNMPSIGSALQPLSSPCYSNDAASPVSSSGTPGIVPVSSPIALPFFTLPRETPFHSPEPSFNLELYHSPEHQQPASQTHTSSIVDGADASERNARGQYQWKHPKPQSLQAIMWERARANE
ncbi:hypothetical protein B0H13DRAFT_2310329 [Mycena leptocephala]|nr:hypothetical protein B0H13DRAFT_2310329 [Mycena leptocephala]